MPFHCVFFALAQPHRTISPFYTPSSSPFRDGGFPVERYAISVFHHVLFLHTFYTKPTPTTTTTFITLRTYMGPVLLGAVRGAKRHAMEKKTNNHHNAIAFPERVHKQFLPVLRKGHERPSPFEG